MIKACILNASFGRKFAFRMQTMYNGRMKETIQKILLEFQSRDIPSHIRRNDIVLANDEGRLIHTIIGPRRSGKTYKMYEIIQDLLDAGFDKQKIIFISFDDNRLNGINVNHLESILEAYQDLYVDYNISDCIFFFDEIQNVIGWESFVRRIYDKITRRIYLTGSNSKMLSIEIATALRGRSISTEVLPLSFNEFLLFKNFKPNINKDKDISKVKKYLDEYIQYGSYPEVALINDKNTSIQILQNYFDSLIYKDVVERYKVEEVNTLRQFSIILLDKNTRSLSINKIFQDFKSQKINTSNQTLAKYLEYMQSVYLGKVLYNHEASFRKSVNGEKKFYLLDNGIYTANMSLRVPRESDGYLLESAVYQELLKKRQGLIGASQNTKGIQSNIYFYKNNIGECDFVIDYTRGHIGRDNVQAIQVCIDINNQDTKDREIKGLIQGMIKLKTKNGIIITNVDKEEVLKIEEYNIKIIPIWKWFLSK